MLALSSDTGIISFNSARYCMREIGIEYDVATINIPVRDAVVLRVASAATHQSKNLYNTGLFLIRQVQTAYEYDPATKVSTLKADADLDPKQIAVIDHFNATIDRINTARAGKLPRRSKDPDALPKFIARLTPTLKTPLSIVLNDTVLDNAARSWPNEKGETVYARLPAAMAQQTLRRLKDAFSGYFASVQAWNAKSAGMTGRPRLPDYLHKHDRFVLEIQLAAVRGPLPSMKGKVVPEDYAETSLLPESALAHMGTFEILAAIAKACDKRGWTNVQPQHLRIVPLARGVKFEAVVRVERPYPKNSFLARLVREHGETLAALPKAKQREAWLADHLKHIPMAQMPRVAAIDLGLTNLASIAFNTGHKAMVTSGGRFDAFLADFNDRLDAMVSRLTPEPARVLQGKKKALQEQDQKLPKSEEMALRKALKAVYADPAYRALVEAKQRWTKDFLHKLSRGIVRTMVERRIDVIVIGRNKGWKQEMSLGRKTNRRFGQVAHATLIELIRYKAQSHGIAVVQVEESYTSKTSFVENEALRIKDEPEETQPAACSTHAAAGTRSAHDRNRFVHKHRQDRWKVVHADVNGAFNILRKAFAAFKYHVGLTLKFTLYRVSARCGMTPILQ